MFFFKFPAGSQIQDIGAGGWGGAGVGGVVAVTLQ